MSSTISASDQKRIRVALNQYFAALTERNIAFVCAHSYTAAYLANLNKAGGCEASTKLVIGDNDSFSGKVHSIGADGDSSHAVVYATVTIKKGSQSRDVSTILYYTDGGGVWRRDVPSNN